jgi:hypothetical protein
MITMVWSIVSKDVIHSTNAEKIIVFTESILFLL